MENIDKGVKALERYAGPSKELLLQKINACPKAFSNAMLETHGTLLDKLQTQFSDKEIALAAFYYRIGANLELAPGVLGLLSAGYSKTDIENCVTGMTVLTGYGKILSIWPEINAAFEVWDSLNKVRQVS
jgi:hypothetical protein